MKKIIFPILTILWMTIIFLFSIQTGEQSANVSGPITDTSIDIILGDKYDKLPEDKQEAVHSNLHLIIRKAAHFTIYGILGCLVFFSIIVFKKTYLAYPISLLFTFFYAQFDEFHQMLTPGRCGLFADVLIDTSGAIIFLGITFLILLLIKHHKKNKEIKMEC